MWDDFSDTLYTTAFEVVGVSKRSHQDWFGDNNMEIRVLLQRKNRAHIAAINNPSSQRLRAAYADLRSGAVYKMPGGKAEPNKYKVMQSQITSIVFFTTLQSVFMALCVAILLY